MMKTRIAMWALSGALLAGGLATSGCGAKGPEGFMRAPASVELKGPQREFRAAWVCTVANINWPSKPGLPVEEQKAEAIAFLDDAKAMGLNAVVFQVRPSADAVYPSELEPWSYFLTGEQGKAPEPFYDPLELWVTEAHARGLELHAWFNPYRAGHSSQKGGYAASSLVTARPDLAKPYGNQFWIDPAEPDGQAHTLAVFMDVVKRYDVDGIHIDDYFYPYKVKDDAGAVLDFPDEPAWARYTAEGGTLERGDWRRSHVNSLVEEIYTNLRATSPHVKFGISPFGLCRPNMPEGVPGFDQYDQLYADAKLWLNEGWIDYWTPQLYWAIDSPQSFPKLLDFWIAENTMQRHVWPGMGTYNYLAEKFKKGPQEVVDQIEITRERGAQANGQVHFQIETLRNKRLRPLIEQAYGEPALVPASPWLDAIAPEEPFVNFELAGDRVANVAWAQSGADANDPLDKAFVWVLATKAQAADPWAYQVVPAGTTSWTAPEGGAVAKFAVAAVDRTGNMGRAAVVKLLE